MGRPSTFHKLIHFASFHQLTNLRLWQLLQTRIIYATFARFSQFLFIKHFSKSGIHIHAHQIQTHIILLASQSRKHQRLFIVSVGVNAQRHLPANHAPIHGFFISSRHALPHQLKHRLHQSPALRCKLPKVGFDGSSCRFHVLNYRHHWLKTKTVSILVTEDRHWRRGRDSNPRRSCPLTRFPSVRTRPLCDLSRCADKPRPTHYSGQIEFRPYILNFEAQALYRVKYTHLIQ